jgi:short-subunit dehydrogenase
LLGPAAVLPREDQLGIIDLNVRALTDLTLRFLPGMVARGEGGVINLSSVAGFLPGPNMALYYASKAFVRSFSEALWEEVRGTGVRVTCVAPGPVATGFLAKADAGGVRLFKLLPKRTAEQVARSAWDGFKRGRRMVTPGFLAAFSAFCSAHLPHALTLPLVARLQRRRS